MFILLESIAEIKSHYRSPLGHTAAVAVKFYCLGGGATVAVNIVYGFILQSPLPLPHWPIGTSFSFFSFKNHERVGTFYHSL